MKNLLLSICFFFLTAPALRAQTTTPDIVLVRIIEYNGFVTATITRGPGKTEYLEFDSGIFKKQIIAASEKYYDILFKLYHEGYVLQSAFTPLTGANSSTTMLVLNNPTKP